MNDNFESDNIAFLQAANFIVNGFKMPRSYKPEIPKDKQIESLVKHYNNIIFSILETTKNCSECQVTKLFKL